jgi:hypothetical protein
MGEDPCVFLLHEELLVAFDKAEHGDSLAEEDVPSNNVQRKKEAVHTANTYTQWWAIGAGVRQPLPSCCVSAIQDMLPSDSFMGFLAE